MRMPNEKLSQEEIDSLLSTKSNLTDFEKDAIGELGNISMGAAATAISTIVGKKVEITTPHVMETTINEVKSKFKGLHVVTAIDYVKGLEGTNAFILEPHVVAVIADIMMGGTGQNIGDDLDDIKLSAIGEAMNQMMGSASTSLSEVIKETVEIAPPKIEKINFDDDNVQFPPVYEGQNVVVVNFKMKVNDLVEGSLIQLLAPSFAKKFASFLINSIESKTKEKVPEKIDNHVEQKTKREEKVKKVEFQELKEENNIQISEQKIEMLLDIPLEISVELGRAKMSLKQVLELGNSSLIELDKLTGEPVDILVNGKKIARGEVVVVGENFGVKITQVLSKKERLYSLK